jgi:hypothetical protein
LRRAQQYYIAARRIRVKNTTHAIIDNANIASAANNACCVLLTDSTAKNTVPIAAIPAALAI